MSNQKLTAVMPFSIRPAVLDDYDALLPLYAELDEYHRAVRPDIFRVPQGPRRERSSVDALIVGPDTTILIAEARDCLIGFSIVLLRTVMANPVRNERRFVEIDNLIVTENARRQGVARALLIASTQWAKAKGVASIELSVWEFNHEALSFYEAEGFQPIIKRLVHEL